MKFADNRGPGAPGTGESHLVIGTHAHEDNVALSPTRRH
jgi:hypothetical protein